MSKNRLIFIVGVVVLLLSTLFGAFYTIDAGNKGVVLRFGAVEREVGEGLHLKIPFIEDVKVYNARLRAVGVEGSGASKDLQSVHTAITVNFSINPEQVGWIYTNLPADFQTSIIQPNVSEIFKAVTAKYNVDELITKRETVKNEIAEMIKQRLAAYKLIVNNVSITNFVFSEQFNKAIEAKQVAEQEYLRQKNLLEKTKVESEQKITQAKAEAESLKLQNQVVTPLMVELRKIEVTKELIDKWDGQGAIVPQTVLGDSKGLIVSLPK